MIMSGYLLVLLSLEKQIFVIVFQYNILQVKLTVICITGYI